MVKKQRLTFAKKIIDWYHQQKRNLPWRETKDPYKVWLSEIILQQTRVAQGLPYYNRFVENFPTIKSLAAATEQDVLRLWQGLGYYSRARNLHKCAKEVVAKGGVFPNNFMDLKKLPGIGNYTAAAIASFCFDEAVPVVDGNVYRVLSRVFDIDVPIQTPKAQQTFFEKARQQMPPELAATFNQAMMEFGALQCVPKNPDCENCVLKRLCVAKASDKVELLPVKEKKIKVKQRYFYYLVHQEEGKMQLKQRQERDIWQGLYDFDLIESKEEMKEEVLLKKYKARGVSKIYKHVLTHQIIYARFVLIEKKPQKTFNMYTKREIEKLPKPKLISQYLYDIGMLNKVN